MKNKEEEEFKKAACELKNQENISRLGISFGNPSQESINSSIKLTLNFSKEEAEKQLIFLTKSIKNKEDPNFAIVCEFYVKPENQAYFIETLENMYGENHQISELNQALFLMISSEQIRIEHFINKDANKVYVIIKLGKAFEEVAISQVKLFNFLGLEKILKETKNSLEIKLTSKNTMKNVLQIIKNQNQNLLSSLLQHIGLEIILKAGVRIAEDLLALLENMGIDVYPASQKGFGVSTLILFLKKMKNFDIDLRFDSTDKLDESFRKKFLDSILKIEKIKIDKWDEKNYKNIMKLVEGEFSIYFTISEICALKILISVPDFLELFDYYSVVI